MKKRNKVISVIITVTQSKWMPVALMMLALLVSVLGVASCKKSAAPASGAHAQQYTCSMPLKW